MSEIKAIPTRYKGYHFRSRLEARWAVLLDALNIVWVYEHEGYQLGGGELYLPDFWLPDRKLFLETKGCWPTDEERAKAQGLHDITGFPVLLAIGLPTDSDGGYVPFGFECSVEVPVRPASCRPSLSLKAGPEAATGFPGEWGEEMECPACGFNYVHLGNSPEEGDWDGRGGAIRVPFWGECGHAWDLRFGFHKGNMYAAIENCREHKHGPVILADGNVNNFEAAIAAARSARFEHGESGAT